MDNFRESWKRIKDSTGIRTQKELAEALDITPQAVTEMKRKGRFPDNWGYKLSEIYKIDARWIIDGQGASENNQRANSSKKSRKIDFLNTVEEWLCEEVGRNPKLENWFEIEFEKKFQEFKTWKEEKEESEARENSTSTRKVA